MSFDCDEAWLNFCENSDNANEANNTASIIERDIFDAKSTNVPKCSSLYISTTTKISYFDRSIDLFNVFWKIPIISYSELREGCVKKQIKYTVVSEEHAKVLEKDVAQYDVGNMQQISYVCNPNKNIYKDVRKINIGLCEKDITSMRCKKKGAFYNCFVLILRLFDEDQQKYKETHVKVFNTGKLELPGIKSKKFHKLVLDYLVELLYKYCDIQLVVNDKHETVLINSNFSCGYCINREKLARILQEKYFFETAYDPCSYPGIMSKWTIPNTCVKISFMIFRTGSVLIVGKCTEDDIDILYNHLQKMFNDEYSAINVPNCVVSKPKNDTKSKYRRKYLDIVVDGGTWVPPSPSPSTLS